MSSIARHHAEWLSLLEISGPFLSMPVLLDAFPQGLVADDAELASQLRAAYEEWVDNQGGLRPDPAIHTAWVRYVLRTVLEMDDEVVREGQSIPESLKAVIAEHGEVIRPDLTIAPPGGGPPHLLIQVHLPEQPLDHALADHAWKASPATRMMELLHATGLRLGLLTNGEQWTLVHARPGETTTFVSWYADLWLEERLTLRAFRGLLGMQRFFGVPEDETLAAMIEASADEQHEVTDQLGRQVRQAVEILIQAIDRADQDRGRALLGGVSPATLYEAALTVMMRLVFLLTAEERGLLLLGDPIYDQHYAVSTLRGQLREMADQRGEQVLERRFDAWSRLLATFRAVYGGVQHEDLRLPPYGGDLFDPDRFPFLEGRPANTTWRSAPADPLPVNNRTTLHLLEALQILQVKVPGGGSRSGSIAEARRLSFRALDIEQIGHVYEGLLDHVAKRAGEPVVGLVGTKNQEPEIPVSELEVFVSHQDAKSPRENPLAPSAPLREDIIDFLKDRTGRTKGALRNGLKAELDPVRAERLRAACGNDPALTQRIAPFAGLIRDDDYGFPVVIPAGNLYVTEGPTRRATGTHYTPRSLTEPIVQHTLEPLVYVGPREGKPREEWRLRAPAELLDLKLCDMAMGSGAFLVQACRYLSERLVEAWEDLSRQGTKDTKGKREGELGDLAALREPEEISRQGAKDAKGKREGELGDLAALREPRITPEGQPATGAPGETIIPKETDERLTLARRLVAERCLYGVDKNPLAVEMAKLSLWLITLDKGRAFTFLDHALKCGDSLVGVDLEQLICWQLDIEAGAERHFDTVGIQAQIDEMVALRREIAATPVLDSRDQARKADLLARAEAITHDLRRGGDLLVASYYNEMTKTEQGAMRDDLLRVFRDGKDVPAAWAEAADLGDPSASSGQALRPFHWPLEFPEVFIGERGGFDGFVGNPPFIGGRRIRETMGDRYREALYDLYPGSSGNADYCAFFFLRAFDHLREGGTLGLIATNTIAQGDTLSTGLDAIVGQGGTIYWADNNRPWPGQAAVVVNVVHLSKGKIQPPFVLDDHKVKYISKMLDPRKVSGDPYSLKANQDKSFQGSVVVGIGFVLDPEEAQALMARDPRNEDVIFPYLNGQDLNSSPDQSPTRWVINFFDWPLRRGGEGSWKNADREQRRAWKRSGIVPDDYPDPVAADYPECLGIVRERVKPHRDTVRRKAHRKYWWHYGDKRPALYETISSFDRVLIRSRVSNTHAPAFVPTGWVYSEATVVFALEDYTSFAILQSSAHEWWARQYSSTLKGDVRYSPTNVLDTFAFPHLTPRQQTILEQVGEIYHEHRRQIMLDRQEGLTETYNRFHDPDETAADIARLRELHVEMDRAVAAAYGWEDLALGHGFHETPQGVRFTISEEARWEVLDRLLALNHARYEEEVRAGSHGKKKSAGRKSKVDERQMELL